jgi:uncharacterized 2Fe-2S/4Fe-4S cluster protein (DUF4445 family)
VSPPRPAESEFLSPERTATGYRLACQTVPLGDCRVGIPPESLTAPQRAQVEGEELPVQPEPSVRGLSLRLDAPALEDSRADAGRLADALRAQWGIQAEVRELAVLRELPGQLRQAADEAGRAWHVQAMLREKEIIGVFSMNRRPLGLAFDLGTTKIAAYLVDLPSGRTLASCGSMNPQIGYGEDVIARITLAIRDEASAALLRTMASDALNAIAEDLCAEVGADPAEIVESVVVGNTAMHHLFLGLPVRQLALAPYVAAVSSPLDVKPRDLGLKFAAGGNVHFLANIAGYIGGDHVAMLLATDSDRSHGATLAIDIGTNSEICLAREGNLASASCASGPAFEGAHIRHGMRAAVGAIEHLRLREEKVEYQTIGGEPPVGLCGSGLLDAAAELVRTGVVDRHGRMGSHPRVRETDGDREFVLVSEAERSRAVGGNLSEAPGAISLTQRDVRQLQLAKGALRTGIELLLQDQAVALQEIEAVVIAGAFGTYIDVGSAIAIGMLPNLPLERFRQVGNAAGMGAKRALVSLSERRRAADLASRVRYLELAAHPRFADTFARSMLFDRT